ncbi:MAG: hypothetical protein N2442_04380 [Spirochaetes bacterium]|nr:hypothetical protein [Spirochaetota bacterium]
MQEKRKSVLSSTKIDRLVDSVIQLVEHQQQFIRQLEPVLQLQRSLETNFQLLVATETRTVERLEKLAAAQASTEERMGQFELRMEELAEAQKRTEERMGQLELRMEELAEAQKRTEERMGQLELRMEELAEAQKRTEERMGQLELRMEELTEAQKRTEQQLHLLTLRVDQLAEAQKISEQKLAELAEAQKRTEDRLDRTNQLLGNLSMSFGYFLENESYKYLPNLLAQDYGMEVKTELIRSYLQDVKGEYLEVNILGEGVKNGESFLIVGESKSQLSVNAIDKFIYKKLERIALPTGKKLFPVLVCHMVSGPDVPEYAKRRGIALYYSYQFR